MQNNCFDRKQCDLRQEATQTTWTVRHAVHKREQCWWPQMWLNSAPMTKLQRLKRCRKRLRTETNRHLVFLGVSVEWTESYLSHVLTVTTAIGLLVKSSGFRIFRTIRRTWNPLIFSKIESAPYNAVRLMYKSGCAFSSRTNCTWQTVLFISLLDTILL